MNVKMVFKLHLLIFSNPKPFNLDPKCEGVENEAITITCRFH